MPWWIWLAISIVLGIVEMLSFTFVLLWISISALVTALLTALTPNLAVQVALFVIISAILLAVTRPMARNWRKTKAVPSRLDVLVGKRATVLTAAGDTRYATVRVDGETWSADTDAQVPLVVGQSVQVVGASATVLHVIAREEGDL